jgi:hypothetical protein
MYYIHSQRILEGAQWNLNNLITCEMHRAAKHHLAAVRKSCVVFVVGRRARAKVKVGGALKNY